MQLNLGHRLASRGAGRAVAAMAVPVIAAAVLAGCGSSSSSPTAAAGATSAAGSSTGSANGYTAYLSCLQQHGVTFPARPSGGARPSGRPSGGFGGGGGGGGFGFGGGGTPNPAASAAEAACASVRPTGGAGFGGGGFGGGAAGGTALVAFRNCMTQQGVTIPTTRPTAFPSGAPTASAAPGSRYLDGLNASDPKVAAALKVCEPLIPTRGASPTAAG
jgi:hypothetical protein